MKCLKTIDVDGTNCYKNCEGMHVTSYDEHEIDPKLSRFVEKLSSDYNDFKGAPIFPLEVKGKILVSLLTLHFASYLKNLLKH